jgi:hypothetical protein
MPAVDETKIFNSATERGAKGAVEALKGPVFPHRDTMSIDDNPAS